MAGLLSGWLVGGWWLKNVQEKKANEICSFSSLGTWLSEMRKYLLSKRLLGAFGLAWSVCQSEAWVLFGVLCGFARCKPSVWTWRSKQLEIAIYGALGCGSKLLASFTYCSELQRHFWVYTRVAGFWPTAIWLPKQRYLVASWMAEALWPRQRGEVHWLDAAWHWQIHRPLGRSNSVICYYSATCLK